MVIEIKLTREPMAQTCSMMSSYIWTSAEDKCFNQTVQDPTQMLVVFLFAKCLTKLDFGYCTKKLPYYSPVSDSEFLDNSLSII